MKSQHVHPYTSWGILAVAVILLGLVVGPRLLPYLGANLSGPDIGSLYKPLVRHEISQLHCYDAGNQNCESAVDQSFSKEFTLGYLFKNATPNPTTPVLSLYSCTNTTHGFSIGTTTSDCKKRGFPTITLLGFIFQTPAVEAPFPLYRCFGNNGQDALLTDDPNECSVVSYNTPTLLGYMAGAAYLPQQRLNDVCSQVKTACSQYGGGTGALKNLCTSQTKLCIGPQ